MKNILLKIINTLALIILTFSTYSQINYEGSLLVTGYYGFPNFGKSLFTETGSSASTKTTGLSPSGIKGEYFVTDQVAIGFDFIYNTTRTKSEVSNSVYDSITYVYNTTISHEERLMQRIRFMARLNIHFETSNSNLDPYFGIGIGTNNRYRKFWIDGVRQSGPYYEGTNSTTFLPFSMRLCTGLNYFFTPKIGMTVEAGLGGPLMSVGLSIKIK